MDVRACGINKNASRRSRNDRLGRIAGGDIAARRPNREVATTKSEYAGLANFYIPVGEDGNRTAVFGDDAWRGEGIAKDVRCHSYSTAWRGNGDCTATGCADVAGAGEEVAGAHGAEKRVNQIKACGVVIRLQCCLTDFGQVFEEVLEGSHSSHLGGRNSPRQRGKIEDAISQAQSWPCKFAADTRKNDELSAFKRQEGVA